MTGTALEPEARARLQGYLDELHAWNARLNLTTVPAEAAWDRHVGESLHLLTRAAVPPGSRCVDIGSGGGIPGVVVAVVRADVSVALVESDVRKAGFLVHVCGLLELDNVTVLARRAEELGHDPAHRESYDVALSRAAAPPPLLCELALPLLRLGGSLFALVGESTLATEAAPAAQQCGGSVRLDSIGVLAARKLSRTPGTMPRRHHRRARPPA